MNKDTVQGCGVEKEARMKEGTGFRVLSTGQEEGSGKVEISMA
jgi:hypothetical protein